MQAPPECHVEAVGQKGDKDVSFDASLIVVKDRPDPEITFEVFECRFDGDQLKIITPQLRRIILS
jgi:hypothetical protein